MLYEDDVIEGVMSHLENDGYEIITHSQSHQHGYDIIAKKDNETLYVEAKGETSSKQKSNRYGKEFSSTQKRGHVASAIYKSMETKNRNPTGNVAVAFPKNQRHEDLIKNVLPSLNELGIKVFFVDSNKTVTLL